MKVFRMRDFFDADFDEFIIGTKATGKHTVYLVYGEVPAGEARAMAPNGHDEILFLLSGEAVLEDGGRNIPLTKEQAVSLEPDERFNFRALADCRYVVAGAHTNAHAH